MLILSFHVLVHHCADAGVGPDVLGSLYHVDDGIDGQDDSHDADRGVDTRHEGEREEIAAHRYAGIAYGGKDGDEEPENHGGPGERHAAVLHQEERGNEDESRTTVHVDGGADGQYEARHLVGYAQTILGCLHRHWQCGCRTLGE